jgi:hypothetical protein
MARLPSPALVIAFIALLAGLSGTAIGLPGKNSVDKNDIRKGAVRGKAIAKNAVTGSKIKGGAVRSSDVGNDSLTGDDVNESSLAKVPSAAAADNAGTLDGADSEAFKTASASAERTADLALTTSNQTIVQASITLTGPRSVSVTAAIDVSSDGGDNDNVNCNTTIAGTDGIRMSQQVMDSGLADVASFGLTQRASLPAGTHTVLLECNEGVTSNTTVDDAAITAIATG